MRPLFFAVAAVLAWNPAATHQAAPPSQSAGGPAQIAAPQGRVAYLIEQMRAGGLVFVIRHERTEIPSRDDDYTRPANDCTAQRNLSVAGLAGSQETGVALRALAVPVSTVISGPMCRATETARFMFGNYSVEPHLIHHNPEVPGDMERAGEKFAEILRALPPIAGNTALISHGANIFRATGLRLAEGEIGVVRVGADGSFTVVGQVLGSDLGPHARIALSPVPSGQ